ncbi:MAG: hypothetical protein WCX31_15110 [Salinivirgaceae bacterium]|jgi:hypothetical protein
MDDLVQVLLFVLTLVIFIFSALRKQKKKPATNVSPADNLLESLFGIPQPSPVYASVDEEANEEHYAEVEIKPVSPRLPDEGIVAITNKPEASSLIYEEEEKTYQPIDLRTAIIYNEILTRKNF